MWPIPYRLHSSMQWVRNGSLLGFRECHPLCLKTFFNPLLAHLGLWRPGSVDIYKHLFPWIHWANLTQISYGDSFGLGNKILHNCSWSHDQDGHHAYIRWKHFKIFFSGTKRTMALAVGTWYVALGMWTLPNLHKWWFWVDLDLFYGKVKFDSKCN